MPGLIGNRGKRKAAALAIDRRVIRIFMPAPAFVGIIHYRFVPQIGLLHLEYEL